MYSHIADCPFQLPCKFQCLPHKRLARFVCLCKLRNHPEAVVQGNRHLVAVFVGRETVWDKFCQPVRLGKGKSLYAGNIPDGTFGSHRTKCNHMRNMVLTVLLLYILQNLEAPLVIEVNVYIGHRNPVGVEETLKEEVVL
ncbi:hypothetical protein SDC9_136048 [bioreactor metagenome]|uniref:Uncharacterized protein n=1 Tax=bioreactor metagenome TaxID=1076179 RepID=A0A645DHI0_9ZZZZ